MASTANTTYYSINGFSYDYRYYWDSDDDTPTRFDASVSLDVTAAPEAGFTYTIEEVDLADGTIWVDIAPSADTYVLTLDGMNAYTSNIDSNIIGIDWTMGGTSHSSVVLELEVVKGEVAADGYEYGTRYYFVLGGDDLPDFGSLSDFVAFSETDTYINDVYPATGAFGPGVLIPWSDLVDTEVLGADEDIWGTAGRDVLSGGYGDDYFYSSEGNDTYKGGTGWDQVNYANDPAGVSINLAKGTGTDGWGDTDKLISIEALRGSLFDDNLIGAKGGQTFRGLAGDDLINGGKGVDAVRYDRDYRYGGEEGVTVNLAKGFAIDGFGDRDTLKRIEDVRGSDYADKIIGSGAKNLLQGEAGNDVLRGLGGKDVLEGGDGRDKLDGGNGDDILTGGAGFDRFIFSGNFGNDMVTDFRTAGLKEKIDLSDVTEIKTFKDLMNNHISDVGGHAVIDDLNGNTIDLYGVTMDDLAKNDFIF
ncbi:calcium-binding protein [Pseudodonghicola xiamenensis]|uniref:Hemolysin-type calcium-binding repeat-containing protein n=1 Tax=Pseudodonghicola xiamenensis TaxID=337702 RepID=A0A8J3H787_9RHOB|nr:calcium-binding protein [Pseudodonghicola xiamenensis]GHG87049.1 hypothetical protein GCM10010961_15140 [Pseudodonghicola xiamenensis]